MRHGQLCAFPGDTYIADLKTSTKSGKSWLKFLTAVMILSALADFFILQQLFDYSLQSDFIYISADLPLIGNIDFSFASVVVPIALICCYLGIGRVAGKKAREYKAFGKSSSKILTYIAIAIEIATLIAISIIRYFSQNDMDTEIAAQQAMVGESDFAAFDSVGSSLDPSFMPQALLETLLLAAVMFLGAFLSMLIAYYDFDPVASEKMQVSTAHLADDSELYKQTFLSIAASPDNDRKYEDEERRLDEQAVRSAINLSSLTTQLNGILDPADAYDFKQASRFVLSNCYALNQKPYIKGEGNEKE